MFENLYFLHILIGFKKIINYAVDFFNTENTELTEIKVMLWSSKEETKVSAQRANAAVFIAQPL